MKGVQIVRETMTVSVALAAIAFLGGFVVDQRTIGLGIALGLVVGAANGLLIQRVIDSRSAFLVSSIVRMAALSAVAIVVAFLVGVRPTAVLAGIAAAQLVMVGVAVRQGLRA